MSALDIASDPLCRESEGAGQWLHDLRANRLLGTFALVQDALQLLFDSARAGGTLLRIHLQHLRDQRLQLLRQHRIQHAQRGEAKRRERGIYASQQLVQRHPQPQL